MITNADAFRCAQRRLAASVAVITTGEGAAAVGMTATAVTSVSLEPPSLLVCVNRSATLNAALTRTGRFRVSYLGAGQAEVARAFGDGRPQAERFAAAGWTPGVALPAAVADCLCRLDQAVEAGSHSIFIGQVLSVTVGEGRPLLYCDGAYHSLA